MSRIMNVSGPSHRPHRSLQDRQKYRHTPRLDTIQMVENLIKDSGNYPSKNQLWRSLPKQVQYPTFKTILDYLEQSRKIMYDEDGSIVWIF